MTIIEGEKGIKKEEINIEKAEYNDAEEVILSDDYSKFKDTDAAVVFDLGSQNCRVGWSTELEPRYDFESIVSKYRERVTKGTGSGKAQINVGSVVHNTVLSNSNLRSPFDGDVINTIEQVEYIMDYAFVNLGIDTDAIHHPIVMTEPAGNLVYSRNMVTELIFECYQAPSLTYGIDSLFSYYENNNGTMTNDGLVFSAGNYSTNIIPIYDGRARVDLASRIPYGGQPASEYLLKSMQLKYPAFPTKMNINQAQYLLKETCFFANDYVKTLKKIGSENDIDYFNQLDVTVQFPFNEQSAEEKTAEELERIAQNRKLQGERLIQYNEKKKREKVTLREQELESLIELKAAKKVTSKASFLNLLNDYDLENEAELDAAIEKAQKALRRAQEVAMGIEVTKEETVPNFGLVDVPDDELSEDSLREKKKQRLLKAGYEARERIRKAKIEAEERKAELIRQDEEYRKDDFDGWLANLRAKHDELDEKLQNKNKIKNQLLDRRSQASQLRMKSIAMLAREEKVSNSKRNKKRDVDDDNFGMDDSDWNVYKKISKEEDSSEEEDNNQLAQYEAQLLEFDPSFQTELEAKAQTGFNPVKSFLHRFQFGTQFNSWEEMNNIKHHHQLHVNVERVKIPEVLFQPNIVGLDCAGVEETLEPMLRKMGPEKHLSLIKNALITGGFGYLPGLKERIESILIRLSPPGANINVKLANHLTHDAWKGAARFARDGLKLTPHAVLTLEQYNECGHDYLLDHGMGNWV